MDDFLLRALAGGVGLALATGPIGCFVVWRRMAYFGEALAHGVLLGVALGYAVDVAPTAAVLAVCVMIGACLTLLERQRLVAVDALLGVLAYSALAAGLVVNSFIERIRVDLMGYLFGDILSVNSVDIWLIFGTAAAVTITLALQWRNLLAITVNQELAAAEGINVVRARLLLVVLLAAVVSVGMKIVGVLLVVALVIIPAAAARPTVSTPEAMAVVATAIGLASVAAGMFISFEWDLPAGPSIVLVATAFFLASLLFPRRRDLR